jgi:tetratricopeptide (TPR) repeat protein
VVLPVDSSYLVQAITDCEQTITAKLDNQQEWQTAFKNLGNLLQGMGQFERAIIWHSLALETKANLGEVYCQLGELHILEQNWLAALTCFENALEYLPNSAGVYSSLAQINGHLQRREAEMDYWYRATKINPRLVNSSGYYKLAKALELKGKIPEAIASYEQAIAGDPKLIPAIFDLGEIYLRQHQLDKAKTIYEQILAVEPTETRARYKLGTIYLQKQCFEEAIACFHQTIKDSPDFPWAYRDLVKTFLQLQKWDEAISTCYAILNLVEEYPWVYGHLGNALREKGRHSEAAVNFQKACEHRGWHQCVTKNYFFTQDVFSYRIPAWEEHLKPLINSNIQAIEVGNYQGMSCCWMLDTILTRESDRLICIDQNFNPQLKENLAKTGSESKVTLLEGDIHQLLADCTPNSFNLINLQDRCKLAEHNEKNALLAWQLLQPEGLIIFNYYGWRNPTNQEQNPQLGIDRFLHSVKGQWQAVYRSPQTHQLIIRKLSF